MATHFDAYLRGTGKLQLDGTVTGFNNLISYEARTTASTPGAWHC
jgi:hypothetical protein